MQIEKVQKRKLEPIKSSAGKRSRMHSSNSDSGFSSLSSMSSVSSSSIAKNESEDNKWPSLVLLSKSDEVLINGRNRKRFPDPVRDRSILLACFDSDQKMHKLRHYKRSNSVYKNVNIYKERLQNSDKPGGFLEEEETCDCFVSLDSIEVEDDGSLKTAALDLCNRNIILGDVRDHKVASECLPDQVTGYWIRILGQKLKYTLRFSLWKNLNESNDQRSYKFRNHKFNDNNKLMKIGELAVDLVNTGIGQTVKKKKRKCKSHISVGKRLVDKNFRPADYTPSFCCKEKYIQIVTCLRECVENGKYELFCEMYEKFTSRLNLENQDDKELKIFLDCEQSQFFAIQGKFSEAKKLLQKCVENVIPKSINKVFLLNRAYLLLANTHVLEGNIGTAEECLTILQFDKKNGMSFEDIGCLNLMHAVVAMHFGISLPNLSNYLFEESERYLKSAISNFRKLPHLFTYLCRSHLNLARLHVLKSQKVSCELASKCRKIAMQEIGVVENFGTEKLSECTKCLLNIVQAELLFYESRADEADERLSAVEAVAKRSNFHEMVTCLESLKEWWTKQQYDEFLKTIKVTESNYSENLSESEEYFADLSCISS